MAYASFKIDYKLGNFYFLLYSRCHNNILPPDTIDVFHTSDKLFITSITWKKSNYIKINRVGFSFKLYDPVG